VTLCNRRKFNLDEDCGILGVADDTSYHVVLLRDGVIVDPQDGCIWFDPTAYTGIMPRLGPILRVED